MKAGNRANEGRKPGDDKINQISKQKIKIKN